MTLLPDPTKRPLYDAAKLFVARGLERDDSLFTPGRPIWSLERLDALKQHFIDRPDESTDRFEVKLQRQMADAPADVVQLMGEVVFVYFLTSDAVGEETKRQLIERVLSWSPQPVEFPASLAPALRTGIARAGTSFNTHRFFQLAFLIEFARGVKQRSARERATLLQSPWAFKEFVFELPIHAAQTQREALLHLVHPDSFEPLVSQDAKRRIVDRLGHLAKPTTTDPDRKIAEIRESLAAEHGEFHFYDPVVRSKWQPDASPWGRFVGWAERFYASAEFDEAERDYKLQIADQLEEVRKLLRDGVDDWLIRLKRCFNAKSYNLTAWQAHSRLMNWLESEREAGRAALDDLWNGAEPVPSRVDNFVGRVRDTGITLNAAISLASVLLMAIDAVELPPYRSGLFGRACELTKEPKPATGAGAAERYEHAMSFLDKLTREASARGVELRDRLDAQSVLWAVLHNDLPEGTSERDKKALEQFRGGTQNEGDDDDPSVEVTMQSLADQLLLDRRFLERVERLLKDKRQVVFHGPPGTGKTFVARQLARHLAASDDDVVLVQFHPSYAYEDFVEGYRPSRPQAGRPGFVLREGPLKELARRAADAPGRTFILIIDELNRGNVAKVFGELYFLLEYRDEQIRLQYSDEAFQLPPNLWFIATMNTADRSIALVDAALRRRFHFVPFFPDEPPIDGLLRRWLEKNKRSLVDVADAVALVNRELDDRNLAIGPSHFLREDLDAEWVELVWEHSVIPYLEEHLFGDHERLRSFGLAEVRKRLANGTTSPSPDA